MYLKEVVGWIDLNGISDNLYHKMLEDIFNDIGYKYVFFGYILYLSSYKLKNSA
jgi:hypothetical protein